MENKFDDFKRDTVSMGIPAFSDQIPTTSPPLQALLDIPCEADKTYSLGFLDALFPCPDNYTPIPPLCSNTIFDLIHTAPPLLSIPPPPSHSHPAPSPASTSLPESSEVVNTPPTPNSSSLSSSSNEATAANDDQHTSKTAEEDEQDQDKTTKKQLKPKKKNQKREREARFAFMTKSEVDHLDDGYRWRKYGQKAVKNSHFPRSYYRCTTASCGVKKRVERWCEDPSIVVTTYEGTHTHPCPIKHGGGGGLGILPETAPAFFRAGITTSTRRDATSLSYGFENVIIPPQLHYPLHQQHQTSSSSTYFQTHPKATLPPSYSSGAAAYGNTNLLPPQGRSLPPSSLSSSSSSLIRDHGLLQDMVPSQMVKEEPKKE